MLCRMVLPIPIALLPRLVPMINRTNDFFLVVIETTMVLTTPDVGAARTGFHLQLVGVAIHEYPWLESLINEVLDLLVNSRVRPKKFTLEPTIRFSLAPDSTLTLPKISKVEPAAATNLASDSRLKVEPGPNSAEQPLEKHSDWPPDVPRWVLNIDRL